MKTLRLLALAVALVALSAAPLALSGCSTAPSARVAQVQSLKAVAQTADAAVALSAQLYRDGRITAAQARAIADFYDAKFQPAFRLAVAAVNANLDSIASPDLLSLASQLSALVAQYAPR